MSLSRAISLFKRINYVRSPVGLVGVQSIRQSSGQGYSYRCAGYPPERSHVIAAEGIMAFMWWWILWHFWHEPGHVFGEFPYPDPSSWTNEELGVPPDDAD